MNTVRYYLVFHYSDDKKCKILCIDTTYTPREYLKQYDANFCSKDNLQKLNLVDPYGHILGSLTKIDDSNNYYLWTE